MKITVGLGSIDDYISYVSAGADEFFCGYIPDWWTTQYGIFAPLNRREVLYYNVQIGSKSEMEILQEMVQCYGAPVSITLNALYFRPEQYPLLEAYILECLELGFDSFIIADFALLVYLKERGLHNKISITISGELSEMNTWTMKLLEAFHVKRIIFHRKMTPEEMKICSNGYNLEFEAFALNEKCHFHGGFCNSLHCDEFAHICQLPYKLGNIFPPSQDDAATVMNCLTTDFSESIATPFTTEFPKNHTKKSEDSASDSYMDSYIDSCEDSCMDCYIPGQTGCGLCALWDLRDANITHLKLVGRGNYTDDMLEDIQTLKRALQILETSATRESYIHQMKQVLFPNGCSKNCYY